MQTDTSELIAPQSTYCYTRGIEALLEVTSNESNIAGRNRCCHGRALHERNLACLCMCIDVCVRMCVCVCVREHSKSLSHTIAIEK